MKGVSSRSDSTGVLKSFRAYGCGNAVKSRYAPGALRTPHWRCCRVSRGPVILSDAGEPSLWVWRSSPVAPPWKSRRNRRAQSVPVAMDLKSFGFLMKLGSLIIPGRRKIEDYLMRGSWRKNRRKLFSGIFDLKFFIGFSMTISKIENLENCRKIGKIEKSGISIFWIFHWKSNEKFKGRNFPENNFRRFFLNFWRTSPH